MSLRLIGRTDASTSGFVENGVRIGGGALSVFAGLCVVDTKENLDKTLAALARNGITTTRAGVWKPRTSPYDFQGLGKECLPWLFESCGKHGVKLVAIEVLSPQHVEDITRALDDAGSPTSVLLQTGTRNAQNFELLKAVGAQTRFPVLYKRGMGIRLEESLSAAEYIAAAGNTRVAFCLRGVQTHLGEPHRNLADFALVPVVKRLTKLPVCVDPSHAVGNRDDVPPAALQGVIAGADMLLVDVHPDPAHALCDGPQALTLEALPRFLDDVAVARATAHSLERTPSADLGDARARLDDVDRALLALLAARGQLGKEAARHKRVVGKPVRDEAREEENRERRKRLAAESGLDEGFVDELFERIVAWSRELQSREGAGVTRP